jgi:hypothetical protein
MSFPEIVEMLQALQEKSDERFDLTINNQRKTIKIKYYKTKNGTPKQDIK